MYDKPYTPRRSKGPAEDSRISHIRPRPGRRRALFSTLTTQNILSATILMSAICVPSIAAAVPAAAAPELPTLPPVPGNPAFLSRWTSEGDTSDEIIFDRTEPPRSVHRHHPELLRRQIDFGSSTTSDKSKPTSSSGAQKAMAVSTSPTSATVTETAAATATDSGSESSSTASASSALPSAFDGGLGTNFTQPSCPDFLKNMIDNNTFTSCLPFSILLQNSMSFFLASRSVPAITQTLTASCNVVSPACSALMSSYALNLRSSSYCSDDYDRQNPIVRQAYNGLLAYDILYRASCLHAQPTAYNNQSSDYCFADAVTNTSAPTDSYVYYLPLGIPLPAGTQPTCDQCLKDTMAVFESQAGNQSQPISLTYAQGAQLVDQQCGPNFVNQSVPTQGGGSGKSTSAASPATAVPGWLGATVLVVGMLAAL